MAEVWRHKSGITAPGHLDCVAGCKLQYFGTGGSGGVGVNAVRAAYYVVVTFDQEVSTVSVSPDVNVQQVQTSHCGGEDSWNLGKIQRKINDSAWRDQGRSGKHLSWPIGQFKQNFNNLVRVKWTKHYQSLCWLNLTSHGLNLTSRKLFFYFHLRFNQTRKTQEVWKIQFSEFMTFCSIWHGMRVKTKKFSNKMLPSVSI